MKNDKKHNKNSAQDVKKTPEVVNETNVSENNENASAPIESPKEPELSPELSVSADVEGLKGETGSLGIEGVAGISETTGPDEAGEKASELETVNTNAPEFPESAPESESAPVEKVKPYVEPNPEYRPEAEVLGLDEDGTPKISANDQLNKIGKKVISIFAERDGSNLPKLTGTEVTKMCKDLDIETVFQYSDVKKSIGRVILKKDGTYLSLPLDINKEFNFGVDFEAMAEQARLEGKEWGEAEIAKAKQEAELDEQDKNRLSLEKLGRIAQEITTIFEERGKTNLPGVTETEIMAACRNHVKSIGVEIAYTNVEKTLGVVILKEFRNEIKVPDNGDLFTFGIDYTPKPTEAK